MEAERGKGVVEVGGGDVGRVLLNREVVRVRIGRLEEDAHRIRESLSLTHHHRDYRFPLML